jgi:hypothetical protein
MHQSAKGGLFLKFQVPNRGWLDGGETEIVYPQSGRYCQSCGYMLLFVDPKSLDAISGRLRGL